MKGKLFTLEKAPFLAIGLFFLGLAFRYFEDLRKTPPQSDDFYHALTFSVAFLGIGTLSIGLYIGFIIAERNITRNLEKTNTAEGAETDAPS
jgi:uncharacterized protein YneF (UPF0154 family)